jgi:hypothetical protein
MNRSPNDEKLFEKLMWDTTILHKIAGYDCKIVSCVWVFVKKDGDK